MVTIGDLARLGPHLYTHVPGEDELIAKTLSLLETLDDLIRDSENERLKNQIDQLKRECADPRAELLRRLRRWRKKVRWELPGGFKSRVTVWLMMFLFKAGYAAVDNLSRWAKSKGIEDHPAIKNLVVYAMTFDKMLMSEGSIVAPSIQRMRDRLSEQARALPSSSELPAASSCEPPPLPTTH